MLKYVEHKKYYKLKFSVDIETPDDATWMRERMQTLEEEPLIMRCFQNIHVDPPFSHNKGIHSTDSLDSKPSFAIYYREENNKTIERFLFKIRLRFPNFTMETSQTLKEYS